MSDEGAPALMSGSALGFANVHNLGTSQTHEPLGQLELEGEWDCMASCNSSEALYSNPQSSQHKSSAHAAHGTANPVAEESASRVSSAFMC